MSTKDSIDDLMTMVEGRGAPADSHPSDDAPTAYADPAMRPAGGEDPKARFKIVGELGHGGMGVVYKARDSKLGRIVALKSLKPENLENRRIIDRFWREAKAIASLNHFNIIQIYNVLDLEDGLWIEMEFVPGGSLKDRIEKEGPVPEEALIEMGAQLADALHHAHENGICHRDVKPGNILLTERGTPKLGDFGLAQDRSDEADMTVPGTLMGTIFFAAPEQLTSGRNADARSDVYGLGATLYAAAVGEAPRTIRLEKVPDRLRPVIGKCLEEHPDRRYATAADLARALKGCLSKTAPTGARHSVTCPRCGTSNPQDVRFCKRCGEGLAALFEKCPKCGSENAPDTVFCGRCGTNIPVMRILKKAQEAFAGSQFPKAARLWKEALSLDPENDHARSGLARIARIEEDAASLVKKAELALAADNKEAAYAAFREALSLDPRRAGIRERMEALAPELVTLRMRRARTAFALKKYERAHELVTGALEMDPDNTDAAVLSAEIQKVYKPSSQSRVAAAASAVVSMDLSARPANKKLYMTIAVGVLGLLLASLVIFGGNGGNEYDRLAEMTLVNARGAVRNLGKTIPPPLYVDLSDLKSRGLAPPREGVEIRIVNPKFSSIVIEASHVQGRLIYSLDPQGLITSRKK